ncbi:hypothetical protein [uncultured Methanobrevibacter sp.]|uniref:hypothetical protein n=1 Tax=uncultured Methanobrevibacter sp. TaxID=253161 RepID=UPI00261C0EC1|nr:hypothetical protein [uncultured Methanobrevibacter sp.]
MVDFETKVIAQTTEEIAGVDVIVKDPTGNQIGAITISSENQLNELNKKLKDIDKIYVSYSILKAFSEATAKSLTIDGETVSVTLKANKLLCNRSDTSKKELDGSDVALYEHKHSDYAPKSHTLESASTTRKGHVQIINNCSQTKYLDGYALSANQGYELQQKINNTNKAYYKNSLRIKMGRWSDNAGENGSKIEIVEGSKNGVYAKLYCDDPSFSLANRTVILVINGVGYQQTTDQNGKTDKRTINLAKSDAPYIISCFCKGDDNMNPASEQKLLYVR